MDEAMARNVCKVLKFSFVRLAKPKPIRGFDGRPAPDITHAVYPTLTVQGHTESLAPLLITKLGQHPLILGKPWMQKHGVILDMSCEKLAFWPGHCQHPGAPIALPAEVNTEPRAAKSTPSAAMPAKSRAANPTTSAVPPAEPQKIRTESKKAKPAEVPQPIPGVQPATVGVSKLAASEGEKYGVPANPKPKAEPVDETKPVDLAFIGAAPFQYPAKQKDVELLRSRCGISKMS